MTNGGCTSFMMPLIVSSNTGTALMTRPIQTVNFETGAAGETEGPDDIRDFLVVSDASQKRCALLKYNASAKRR
jgi:hypothetical protein